MTSMVSRLATRLFDRLWIAKVELPGDPPMLVRVAASAPVALVAHPYAAGDRLYGRMRDELARDPLPDNDP